MRTADTPLIHQHIPNANCSHSGLRRGVRATSYGHTTRKAARKPNAAPHRPPSGGTGAEAG